MCSCGRALTAILHRNKECHSWPPLCGTFKGIFSLLHSSMFSASPAICVELLECESLLNCLSKEHGFEKQESVDETMAWDASVGFKRLLSLH